MISDFVKGRTKFQYPKEIQQGIALHRAIDEFTDTHQCTKTIKELFRPSYRLYAGAFADVVYDYFLANDEQEFASADALLIFTEQTYAQLDAHQQWLGPAFGSMFLYMKTQNWLYNYRFDNGIEKSMEGLRKRALYIKETNTAFNIFLQSKSLMHLQYNSFFPSLKKFAAEFLQRQ